MTMTPIRRVSDEASSLQWSTITLGYFEDIGCTVDYSAADPYEVVPFFGGQLIPEDNLRNDSVALARPTFVSPIARP